MRVRDTVAYAAWLNEVPDGDCSAAAENALGLVGLQDRAHDRIRTLSGGLRQRVGIAVAIVHEPDVLVLDEPTAGLDPGQRLRTRELIATIGHGRTVLLSTHLIEDVAHVCDTVGVLARGRIAFSGTFAELDRLAGDDGGAQCLGSRFEQAYDLLINRLGDPA